MGRGHPHRRGQGACSQKGSFEAHLPTHIETCGSFKRRPHSLARSRPQAVGSNGANLDSASYSSPVVTTENLFFRTQANHKMEQTVTASYSPDVLKLPVSITFLPDSSVIPLSCFHGDFARSPWTKAGAYPFSFCVLCSSCWHRE